MTGAWTVTEWSSVVQAATAVLILAVTAALLVPNRSVVRSNEIMADANKVMAEEAQRSNHMTARNIRRVLRQQTARFEMKLSEMLGLGRVRMNPGCSITG